MNTAGVSGSTDVPVTALAAAPNRIDAASGEAFKENIVRFMRGASTEITPAEVGRLPELAALLRADTAVYVAHTPSAGVGDVVRAAVALQRAGFVAVPHIVARRLPNALMLRRALEQLREGGVARIMLIAGDPAIPMGEFSSTLDVLESGALELAGIKHIGVAGHPEGHKAIGPTLLWEALEAKQTYADRNGVTMHIVSQFSFNGSAVADWESQVSQHQIRLPVHVGIAGPAPLPKLISYAMQCGIGASLRTVMRNLSAVAAVADLAITPEQHLVRLLATPHTHPIVAPHFFAFGGCLETARWINRVAAGDFDIDQRGGKLALRH